MKNKGFTLIELLIVIAIAAIIAGAMVPMFNITRKDAKIAKAKNELDAIKTAAITLHFDTGYWPDGSWLNDMGCGLVDDRSCCTCFPAHYFSNWEGPYIDAWKPDPWGHNYILWGPANQLSVFSCGPDGDWGIASYDKDNIVVQITSGSPFVP